MKKSTVRVFAIVLAALMCLSLLPLAAHAEGIEVPEGLEIPGFAWVGDHYEETEHIYGNVVDENYLVDENEPGDCVTPAVYWKSCMNINPYTGERCGHIAKADWEAAMQRTKEELGQRRASGEQADFELIFQNAIAEIDAKYKFTAGGTGHQWEYHEHQEATCEQDGWDTYSVCLVCGAMINVDGTEVGEIPVIPAKDHRWGEAEVVTPATCSEAGLAKYVCEVCGAETTEEIPATGEHDFVDGFCTVCGAEAPDYVAPEAEEVVPVEEPEVEEPAAEPETQEPVAEPETQEPVAEPETQEPVAEPETQEPAAEPETQEPVAEPETQEPTAEPETQEPAAEPEAQKPAEPETQEPAAEPEAQKPAEPETENENVDRTNDTVDFKKEDADPSIVASFKDAMGELGLDEESTAILDVKDVTPVYSSDDKALTDEEVAAMGGLDFVIDLPDDFDPENGPVEVFHFNKETGEWEKMEVELDLVNWKAIIKNAKSFSPFAFVTKKVGAVSPFGSNQKRLDPTQTYAFLQSGGDKGIPGLEVKLTGVNEEYKAVRTTIAGDTLTVALTKKEGTTENPSLDLNDYSYQWWSKDKDGVERMIVGATNPSFKVPDASTESNYLDHYLFCAVSRNAGAGDPHSESSDSYMVRRPVTIKVITRGQGIATYSDTDEIVPTVIKEGNIPVPMASSDSYSINTITGNTITIKMKPDVDNEYWLKSYIGDGIGTDITTITQEEKTVTLTVPASADGKTASIVFSMLHASDEVRSDKDNVDKREGTSQKALDEKVKSMASGAVAGGITYITPMWDNTGSEVTEAQLEIANGVDFNLDYPNSDVKANKAKYDIRVYHYSYSSKDWEQVPASQVELGAEKITVKKYKDFSPFAVIAVPGTSATPTPSTTTGSTITVNFKLKDNEDRASGTMDPKTYTVGANETLPANSFTYDKNKYEPNGWLDQDGKGYAEKGSFVVPSKDLTLTAQWKQTKYTVTYDGAGGGLKTGASATDTVAVDKNATVKDYTDIFTETPGKAFVEWNTKADGKGTSYKAGASKAFNEDVTLYAILKDKVKIYYLPGSRGMGEQKSFDVTVDTPFKLKTLEELGFSNAYAGEIFGSWNKKVDGSDKESYADGQEITVTGETWLYAQWGEPITVTFNANGGSGSMTAQKVAKNTSTPLNSIKNDDGTSNIFRSGYFFTSWNTQADGKGTKYDDGASIKVDKDTTLYAQWNGPLQIVDKDGKVVTSSSLGETLKASIPDATGLYYQWVRGTKREYISGATSSTYKVTVDDMGETIECFATKDPPGGKRTVLYSINKVTIDDIEWVRDIVNDGNTASYGVYAQAGAIKGLTDGMKYSLTRPDGTVETGTISGVSNGVWTVYKEGTYTFTADGSSLSVSIPVYGWYTVAYQVVTASGITSTSAGVRMLYDGAAMPTTLYTSTTGRNADVARYTNTSYSPSTSSYTSSYSSTYTIYAVKKGSSPLITLTVTPPASTYAHVALNGTLINSWGSGTTTTTVNGVTRTTSTANVSWTFRISPDYYTGRPITGPQFCTITFNNSATSPRTADDSNLGLWSALCLVSVVGAATILTESRKRRKNRG